MERKKASDFPQELLDLFDEYVHGGISRRDFIDGAQKFAVGGLTAAALFEMLKPNYALAMQVQPNDPTIRVERVSINSPQGNGKIDGYLVKPANAPRKNAGRARDPREPRPQSVYRRRDAPASRRRASSRCRPMG